MPMPIRVKAVGKPSMMATTTKPSMIRPRCPFVTCPQGMIKSRATMISAIKAKPNRSSLRIVIC